MKNRFARHVKWKQLKASRQKTQKAQNQNEFTDGAG